MTEPLPLPVIERQWDAIAEIISVVMGVPDEDRLDVLAVATRACVQGGLLDNYRRADAAFAPALAAHNRTAGDSIQQRREERDAPPRL